MTHCFSCQSPSSAPANAPIGIPRRLGGRTKDGLHQHNTPGLASGSHDQPDASGHGEQRRNFASPPSRRSCKDGRQGDERGRAERSKEESGTAKSGMERGARDVFSRAASRATYGTWHMVHGVGSDESRLFRRRLVTQSIHVLPLPRLLLERDDGITDEGKDQGAGRRGKRRKLNKLTGRSNMPRATHGNGESLRAASEQRSQHVFFLPQVLLGSFLHDRTGQGRARHASADAVHVWRERASRPAAHHSSIRARIDVCVSQSHGREIGRGGSRLLKCHTEFPGVATGLLVSVVRQAT